MDETKRSNWFKGIVYLKTLDGIAYLFSWSLAGIIALFIAARLWNRNQFWRDVTAYLGIPLGIITGFVTSISDPITGNAIILENIIAIVCLLKSWNEFTYVSPKEKDPKTTKFWRNVVIVLALVMVAIIVIFIIGYLSTL